jgi:hypothetical protein
LFGLRIGDFRLQIVGCGFLLGSAHLETAFMGVILRSKATKNLIVTRSAEILRGVYPEPVEGLRMTWRTFRMDTR